MYDRRPWYIQTLKIEQRKLSTNSNGHKFWLECMIDAHDISRHSKLNNGSSREILMAITFHSDVWFTCIIYRDHWNWPRKLLATSNGHNFLLECMIVAHDISRRSKLNNGSSREIQMAKLFTRMSDSRASYIETLEIDHGSSRQIQTAINFDSNVWSTPMIYRDAQNWTTEALEKF